MSWSATWRTWQGKETPEPSNADCVRACIGNAEEAARREARLRDMYERLDPGDPRIRGTDKEQGLLQQIAAAKSDQRHWREYANWYRDEAKKEGKHWAEREPGQDDEEAPF